MTVATDEMGVESVSERTVVVAFITEYGNNGTDWIPENLADYEINELVVIFSISRCFVGQCEH